MNKTVAAILVLAAVFTLSSCRIGTAVFYGGDVLSASGTRDCMQGRTCEFEVNDTNFSETFTAVPRVGYAFVKWRAGDDQLCGNSTNPVCSVSNVGSEGIPAADAVIASDRMFYLVPEFECVLESCPDILLDTILVELIEQSEIVDAYVAANGTYPATNSQFGLNTSVRGTDELIHFIDIQPTFLVPGGPVYLVAAVYDSLWDGTGTPSHSALSYFSLSGSTNADNSMDWTCIPYGGPNTPFPVPPISYLPIECRGF